MGSHTIKINKASNLSDLKIYLFFSIGFRFAV